MSTFIEITGVLMMALMMALANALLLYTVFRQSQANAALLAALREMLESHRKTLEANQKLSDFNQNLTDVNREILELLHIGKPRAVIQVRVQKKSPSSSAGGADSTAEESRPEDQTPPPSA